MSSILSAEAYMQACWKGSWDPLLGRLGGLSGRLGSHLGADLGSNLDPGPSGISVVPWVVVDFHTFSIIYENIQKP